MSTRIFRPFNRNRGTVVVPDGAPVVEYGTPAVVAPAAPTITVPQTGSTVVPTPGTTESTPSQLSPAEPAPSAVPGPAPSESTGAKSSAGKANYEAYRPRYRSGRPSGPAVAKAEVPTLEPTPRSASGAASASGSDPLENLPPIELSRDVPFRDATPPAAPPAERDAKPSANVAPASAEAPSRAATPAASSPFPAATVNVTPGLRRFASFEPKLSGGSVPTNEGLDWLVEKGYKTILDLREPGEAQSSFIAEVSNRGLRYVALPIAVKTLDAEHVSRFNDELSLSDARPLYFCDTDGARAGILWYIRRITKDRVDPQVAAREAEQIGQIDKPFWRSASAYLDTLKPATPKAPGPGANSAEPPANPSAAADPAPAPEMQTASAGAPPAAFPASPAASDPAAWRSYMALLGSGLVVPLAFWGRSSLTSIRVLARASLSAPARRPKSLPFSSDV